MMAIGIPICSMYGIFTYIWVIFRANVGKYSIHGAYGIGNMMRNHEMFGYIPQLFLDKAIFNINPNIAHFWWSWG